jgi:polyisoprenoid-binding protein YceI
VARYAIVPERSQVWIDARSNVHPIHSATSGLEGFVELQVDDSGAVDLSQSTGGRLSLSVGNLKSGNRTEDREMQKRIDARRYPTIEGTLDEMVANGAVGHYQAKGTITFRGVSRPHEDVLSVTVVDEDTLRLQGSSRFDIREFGMQPPKLLLLKVEPEVDVGIEVFAKKEEGQ